jgi:hypothetical protein
MMALTGRFNFRKSLMGKIVLQVEEERPARWPFSTPGGVRYRWRDARSLDLALPELRGLVELRDFVQERPQANHGGLGGYHARRRLEHDPYREAPAPAAAASSEGESTRKVQGLAGR